MKTNQEKFSVVVSSYNYDKYLKRCLESIIKQDYDPSYFEIICVDDGSTDGSVETIQHYKKQFQNFTFLESPHAGLEKVCNTGIRAAQHPWIIRVDADDFIPLNLISKLSEAIQNKPGADFYYCQDYVEHYSDEEQIPKTLPEYDREEVFSRGDFFASGTAYKKESLEKVGLFPEAIKNCGLENYTAILNMIHNGGRGVAVAGASFFYRRHRTNMSTVKRQAIIEYGKKLLQKFGREFQTNQYHPYGLKLKGKTYV